MRLELYAVAALLSSWSMPSAATTPEQSASLGQELCGYDGDTMIEMDFEEFDQSPESGWRGLTREGRCYGEAAELIDNYVSYHESRLDLLRFHEAQMRAFAGQAEAVQVFQDARKEVDVTGFNIYIDATIAFLTEDIEGLREARNRLANFPVPEDYQYISDTGEIIAGRPPDWPINLGVVDHMLACFGQSYKFMYENPEC